MRRIDGTHRCRPCADLLAWTCLASLALATPSMAGGDALRDSTEITPVWVATIDTAQAGPKAVVTINAFATRPNAGFPLRTIPVTRVVDRSIYQKENTLFDVRLEAAPLDIENDGRLVSGNLVFASAGRMAINPTSGEFVFVSLADSDFSATYRALAEHIVHLDGATIWGEVGRCEVSPDGSYFVVGTRGETYVLFRDRKPAVDLGARSWFASFSANGDRFAETVYADALKSQWWMVVDRSGGIVRKGAPTSAILSQAHLSSDGERLILAEEGDTTPKQTRNIVIDLRTGKQRSSPISSGMRYFSADGKTMAILRQTPGALHLYDISGRTAREIGVGLRESDRVYLSAAISDDGSLVAVQEIDPDVPHPTSLMRVELFDRRLARRAVVARLCAAGGLDFYGRYLVVGTQRNPLPVYFHMETTDSFRMYDLSAY